MITLWNHRQRVVIEIWQIEKQTLRIHIINRTHQTIELKEYGLHLSNGDDLSREAAWPGTRTSFRAMKPGSDFPSDWSIPGLKQEIKQKHDGATVEFAYATDAAIEKYRYKAKVPRRVKRLLED